MASARWTDEETCKLIEIWGNESIQAMLEGCKSKRRADNTNTYIRDAILSLEKVRKRKCPRELSRDTAHAHISVPCEHVALIV